MKIPNELKQLARWVCWKLLPSKDGSKPRKLPIDPKTGGPAKSNDPSTWSDYETAALYCDQHNCSGIGFMLVKSDGLVGIDIDHCYDPVEKTFNETARAILMRQPTYSEFSPSGDGVHLWYRGVKPTKASRNSATGVEMYDSSRYLTVTGNSLDDVPDSVQTANPDTLLWIAERFLEPQKQSKTATHSKEAPKEDASTEKAPMEQAPSNSGKAEKQKLNDADKALLKKAMAAKNGTKFSALWNGDWEVHFESQSSADFSLCLMLAFWTCQNPKRIDRLFRASGLMRDKWDEPHYNDGKTYGEHTIEKAIETAKDGAPNFTGGTEDQTSIYADGGAYYRLKGNEAHLISNFTIKPIEMVVSENETQMIGDYITVSGETFHIMFSPSDFNNLQRFKSLLNRTTISLSYFGTDGDLEHLKSYIAGLDWTRKKGVEATGIYSHGEKHIFVSANGCIDAEGNPVEDYVLLSNPADVSGDIINAHPMDINSLKALGKAILSYNDPIKTVPILGWIAGCFLKSHLRCSNIKFPHLFLLGEAGSGKSTTLERVALPIFSVKKVSAASQMSKFSLMKESSTSLLIPMALDEFKPSKMSQSSIDALYNHLRDTYDCHTGKRGRPDQTVDYYDLLAPMLIAGEESADETAIRERSIEVLFAKKDLQSKAFSESFAFISDNETLLNDFGYELLLEALNLDVGAIKKMHDDGKKLFSNELPSRIVSNLSDCYCGLRLIDRACAKHNVCWDSIFPYTFDDCVKYLEKSAINDLLGGTTNNTSVVEETFEVFARMGLNYGWDYLMEQKKSDDGKILGETLFIRINHIYDRYTKYCRDHAVAGEILPLKQFLKQLERTDYCINKSVQRKFQGNNVRCHEIDYMQLSSKCDVAGFRESTR